MFPERSFVSPQVITQTTGLGFIRLNEKVESLCHSGLIIQIQVSSFVKTGEFNGIGLVSASESAGRGPLVTINNK